MKIKQPPLKTKNLTIRLTPEQDNLLRRKANKAGVRITIYIRNILFGRDM